MKKNKFMKMAVSAAMVTSSIITVAPVATEASGNFSDIKQEHYFYQDVMSLKERGIIHGYADGTFKPNVAVTRGHAAKILVGILKLDATNATDPGFKDVPSTNQYYGAIAALVKAGIMSGYEDATFRPDEKLQRHHMAAILAKAFSLQANNATALPFKDVPANYKSAVAALYERKITTGKTATSFDGKSAVTRGQLAAFIGRVERAANVAPDEPPVAVEKPETFIVSNYSASTITTQAGSYKMSEQVRAIFADSNKAALKNAVVTATVKDGVVTKVTAVTVNASGKFGTPLAFNLNNAAVQDLTINGDYIEVQNATLTNATITGNVQRAATFKNVKITGEFVAQKANIATASLVPVAAVDDGPTISFIESDVYFGRIDRENISLDLDPDSNASTLVISAAVRVIDIHGNVDVFDLSFAADVVLTGEANIQEVLIGAAADLIVELIGFIEVLKVLNPDVSIELTGDVVVGLLNIPVESRIQDIVNNYTLVSGAIRSVVNDIASNSSEGSSGGGSLSGGGGSSGGGSSSGGSGSSEGDGSSDGGGSSGENPPDEGSKEEIIPNAPVITDQSMTEQGIYVVFDALLTEELLKTLVVKGEITDYKVRETVMKFESFDDPRLQVSEGNKRIAITLPSYDAFAIERNVKYTFDYNGLLQGTKLFTIEPSEKFAIQATAEDVSFDGEGVVAFINAYQSDDVLINSDDDGKVDILFENFTNAGEGYQFVLFYNEQAYVVTEDDGAYTIHEATEDDLYIGKENIERSLNIFTVHGTTAFYSPDWDTSYSYVVSENGEDVSSTEYWVTAAEMEAMEMKWEQLHGTMTADDLTLFEMHEALQRYFQAVDEFVAAAQPGQRVQQGLANMTAENGKVTLTFNAPVTTADKAALTIKRRVQDHGEVEKTYDASDIIIDGKTVTITEPPLSAVPFGRTVTYTATFGGEFGQETKTAEVMIEALVGDYLLLTSSENIELEGVGQVVFAGTESLADTVNASMTANNELVLTFDALANVTALGDFVFTINDEEYFVEQTTKTIRKVTEDDLFSTKENLERTLNIFTVMENTAFYRPDEDKNFSYEVSSTGADILTTNYWVTEVEMEKASVEWTLLHQAYKEGATLAQMYTAQQRFLQMIEDFVASAQLGTQVQQGITNITAEDGIVTITFNTPLTEDELAQFTLERHLEDEGDLTRVYNKDHAQIQVNNNTITLTDTFVASAMDRTVMYTAKFNGEIKSTEVTLAALPGESMRLASEQNITLEGEGQVIFVDGGTTADTVTVVTTASQNLVMTFENLTDTADIYRMALLINGEEYYLQRNNSNEMEIEQVEDLSSFISADTLSSEGIEKLLNIISSDSDSFYFNGFFDQPDDKEFHISEGGSDVLATEYWVTPAQVAALMDIEEEATDAMRDGQTMAGKFEAQQKFYKAILQIIEDAQLGSLQ